MEDKYSKGTLTLKLLRERVKKTQTQVAQEVGVQPRSYGAWEREGAIPALDKAVKLARSLDASLSEICVSLGIDISGLRPDFGGEVPETCSSEVPKASSSEVDDYSSVASIIAGRSTEEIAALLRVFLAQKKGDDSPSSE